MTKNNLIFITIWVVLAAGIYLLIDQIENPNKAKQLGEHHTVVLKRGLDGHYRAEALINGEQVEVLVDTGATGVAISQNVADKLKLKSHNAIRTSTANGDAVAYMVRLNTVKLGGVEARDVAATIAPGLEGEVLLGMSYLGRMDVRLYNDEMTIKQVQK